MLADKGSDASSICFEISRESCLQSDSHSAALVFGIRIANLSPPIRDGVSTCRMFSRITWATSLIALSPAAYPLVSFNSLRLLRSM